MNLKYDENSIVSLNWRDGIRQNSSMYIGNTDAQGLLHLMIEVVANSIDEHAAGFGNTISIAIDTNTNRMTVSDEGRGLPFRKNAQGKYAIIEACTSTHAGGKFEGATGYKSALGLHGLGLKLVNALSTEFEVTSIRADGKCKLKFINGQPTTAEPDITDGTYTKTGTTISFIPDSSIFNGLKWDVEAIDNRLQTDALLNNNLLFNISIDGKPHRKFIYKDGIKDLFNIKFSDKEFVTSPVFFKTQVTDEKGYSAEVEYGFAYTSSGSETIYSYINGGYTPNDGTHVTGWKTAYTSFINKMARDQQILKDNEKNFTGDMVRRGLALVLVVRADFRLAFAEQTKLTLNSPEARGLVSKAVGSMVLEPKQLKQILDKIVVEQKAEEAAQRKREAQEKIARGGKSMNSLRDLPEKLADASDFTDAEIFFCEGDSAAGGAKETKAPNQAVMPLRGKILNTTSKDLADAIKSDVIKDILTCLGCGIGDHFNINNLRYNRIIIFTDADADGGHIELLLMTLFLHHLPELVRQGKVYTSISPLFKTTTARETRYWYPDQLGEYRKYIRNHSNVNIVRVKGLGELNPDELYETSMNPEHRRLVQLTTNDMEKTLKLYDTLMGKQPSLRRDFIMKNKLSSVADENSDIFDDSDGDDDLGAQI